MLSGIFKIKTNARAMLTANIDLQDRLGNGLIGTVMHITRNSQGISKIYLKFSDKSNDCRYIWKVKFTGAN